MISKSIVDKLTYVIEPYASWEDDGSKNGLAIQALK